MFVSLGKVFFLPTPCGIFLIGILPGVTKPGRMLSTNCRDWRMVPEAFSFMYVKDSVFLLHSEKLGV